MFGSSSNTGTGFGGFGTNTNTNTGGGGLFGSGNTGGAFGQTNTGFGTQNNASPFGAKPAFGTGTTGTTTGGLFGSTAPASGGFGTGTFGTAGGTSAFGSSTGTTGGLFGSQNKPAFGSTATSGTTGGGMFGTAGTTGGAFGSTGSAFGSAAGAAVPATGTTNPPFSAFIEKDPTGNLTNHFQTITFQGPYQKASLEELRLQDYSIGKRYGDAAGFGTSTTGSTFGTGFGANNQTTGAFGSGAAAGGTGTGTGGGLFGSTTNTASPFGATNTGTTGFGAANNTSGGLFGANKPATGGLFGSTTNNTTGTGGGLFGGNNTASTGTTGFGGFGAQNQTQNQTQTGGGLFGANNNAAKPAFGGFGTNTAATGTTGFGTQQPASTGFGNTGNTGGGLFGSTNTAAPATGFGATNTATPAQASNPFGGFGQNQAQQTNTQQQSGGLFGSFGANNNNAAKPAFGGFGTNTAATGTTGGSLFGNNQQAQTGTTGGLFGNNAAKPAGGLFGNTNTGATGGGLFGGGTATNTGTTGGLFGNNQQQQTGGLFGSNTAAKPAGGMFGTATTANSNTGGGLFGGSLNTNTAGGGSLFGNNQQQQQMGGGMFGGMNNSQNQPQQNQSMFKASLTDSPYGQNPLFSSVAGSVQASPGPIATPLSGSTQKKKAAMIPLNKIAPKQPSLTPRLGSSFSRSASPFSASTASAPISGSLGKSYGASSKLHLFDNDDTLLSSGTYTPGTTSRVNSLKKLVIDKKIRDGDLFSGAPTRDSIEYKDVETSDSDRFRESTISNTPTAEDLGYLRSSARGKARESDIVPSAGGSPSSAGELALVKADNSVHPKGYWMQPSLTKLKAMNKQQLSRVANFTVGRDGYGQVRFEPAVDLSNINLDDILDGIVTFERRICTVYPDTYDKPAEGVELNVPAIISLEDCFPQHKDSRAKITDPEHPRIAAHLARLKSIKDTTFIDYIAAKGVWIFKVQHFTTYGLEGDDDDDMPMDQATPQHYDDADATMDESALEDTFDFSRIRPGSSFRGSRGRQMMGNAYEQDDNESYGQQSFLGSGSAGYVEDELEIDEPAEPEVDADMEAVDVQIIDDYPMNGHYGNELILSPAKANGRVVFDDADMNPALPRKRDWTDQLNATISSCKDGATVWRHDKEAALGESVSSTKEKEKTIKSYDHMDLVADLYGLRGDAAPVNDVVEPLTTPDSYDRAFHRSIKPCWMNNGTLIHKDRNAGFPNKREWFSNILDLRISSIAPFYTNPNTRPLHATLELQKKHTDVRLDPYGVPFVELNVFTPFSSFFEEVGWSSDAQAQKERKVWELASILFDEPKRISGAMDTDPSPEELKRLRKKEARARKEKLSDYLKEMVERDAFAQADNEPTAARIAFALLTAKNIDRACAIITEDGNLRLATLLSLIGGSQEMRDDIKDQLESWGERGVLSEIPVEIRALYELVAGNTCFSKGVDEPPEDAAKSFYMAQEFKLDWKRAFALKLWYGILQDDDISVAVKAYQADLDTYPAQVPRPTLSAKSDEIDIVWGLLKVYSESAEFPLESVLSWKDSSSPTIDHRLAWQLRTLISRRQFCDFSRGQTEDEQVAPALADQLTVQYASQLELAGMWEWAVFVLLHINDSDTRAVYIRNMLARNVSDLAEGSSKVAFLESLQVPKSWIHEARALYARYREDYILEASHLLDAKSWDEAHKTVVQEVAPEAIVTKNVSPLKALLTRFEDTSLVADWPLGGQVYLDYIHLLELTDTAIGGKVRRGMAISDEAKEVACRLAGSLEAAKRVTFMQKVAIGEISKFVGGVVLLAGGNSNREASQLLRLPLSEDQFLKKTLNLSLNYYKARLTEAY